MISTHLLPSPRLTADVYETVDGDAYIVEIPVPGLEASEITIEATPQALTVTTTAAERNAQSERRYLRHEREQSPTSRVFEFPTEIEPNTITANLEAGMLKIQMPKAAAARRRVIKLTSQSSEP